MTPEDLFHRAVRECEALPAKVRDHAPSAVGVQQSEYDESYIEFLDTQIRLCPRGLEWNRRLEARRQAMAPYCRRPCVGGRIVVDGCEYWIKVDVELKRVFHWECYPDDDNN